MCPQRFHHRSVLMVNCIIQRREVRAAACARIERRAMLEQQHGHRNGTLVDCDVQRRRVVIARLHVGAASEKQLSNG